MYKPSIYKVCLYGDIFITDVKWKKQITKL